MKLECMSTKDPVFRFNVLMAVLNIRSWVMLSISHKYWSLIRVRDNFMRKGNIRFKHG